MVLQFIPAWLKDILKTDVLDLAELLKDYPDVELNVEGYPSRDYIQFIQDIRRINAP
jgi:hypothetical protein